MNCLFCNIPFKSKCINCNIRLGISCDDPTMVRTYIYFILEDIRIEFNPLNKNVFYFMNSTFDIDGIEYYKLLFKKEITNPTKEILIKIYNNYKNIL